MRSRFRHFRPPALHELDRHRPINAASLQAAGLQVWFPTLVSVGDAELLRDVVGGADATLTNGPAWSNHELFGPCLSFDGSDDHLVTGDTSSGNGSTALTVSAWVMTSTVSTQRTIARRQDGSGTGVWALGAGWTANKAEFYINDGTWRGSGGGTTSINDGQPHLLTGTYDGAAIRIYVDGVLESSSAATGTLDSRSVATTIGAYTHAGVGEVWSGLIADLRIYARALAAAEIWQLWEPATRWELYRPAPVIVALAEEQTQGASHAVSGSTAQATVVCAAAGVSAATSGSESDAVLFQVRMASRAVAASTAEAIVVRGVSGVSDGSAGSHSAAKRIAAVLHTESAGRSTSACSGRRRRFSEGVSIASSGESAATAINRARGVGRSRAWSVGIVVSSLRRRLGRGTSDAVAHSASEAKELSFASGVSRGASGSASSALRRRRLVNETGISHGFAGGTLSPLLLKSASGTSIASSSGIATGARRARPLRALSHAAGAGLANGRTASVARGRAAAVAGGSAQVVRAIVASYTSSVAAAGGSSSIPLARRRASGRSDAVATSRAIAVSFGHRKLSASVRSYARLSAKVLVR